MIGLDPLRLEAACPHCTAKLNASGWYMPGMRALAAARCERCARDYYVDLPIGQALYSPMLLEVPAGVVHDRCGVPWFAEWLQTAYRNRADSGPELTIQRHRTIGRPVVLLNCLDAVYGHALLKLFNAQVWLDAGIHDVVILAQQKLGALVPDGVAETWLVDLAFRDGARWSDGLAAAIASECARFPGLTLAAVHSHPHPSRIVIERFSRVAPFALRDWAKEAKPKITFVWRDDRTWGARTWRRPLLRRTERQREAVTAFFRALCTRLPTLDAAIAGMGAPGGIPPWITDLRSPNPDPAAELAWLRRYAASALVVGVQGSNMLLPTAHAGGVLEILDAGRRDNFLQDVMFNGDDPRDLMFRYRFFEPDAQPEVLAAAAAQIISRYPDFDRLMARDATDELDPDGHVRT